MKRKIAAILAADVAEYSRLVAEDEEDALRRLMSAQSVFKESVQHHHEWHLGLHESFDQSGC